MRSMRGVIVAIMMVLTPAAGRAFGQDKVTIAIGGSNCLCYLPVVLADRLGEYERAGITVDIVDLKGGSDSVRAVLGGSADVVAGYFDHCVNLAAKRQELESFVVYDRYPGVVLVVSPAHTAQINSVSDLVGKKVGVTVPGSTTDFFLKYLLKKSGLDPASTAVIGIGVGASAVAAVEQGEVDAAMMVDPSVTVLQGLHSDLKILADTRSEKDTLAVFGSGYPGGALYSTATWVASHEKEAQALTAAIVSTLGWIHTHTAEEVMAKMPDDVVGPDRALYLAALTNTVPMYSETGLMERKSADAVLAVFSEGSPEFAKANIDVSKTFTNRFVDRARPAASAISK